MPKVLVLTVKDVNHFSFPYIHIVQTNFVAPFHASVPGVVKACTVEYHVTPTVVNPHVKVYNAFAFSVKAVVVWVAVWCKRVREVYREVRVDAYYNGIRIRAVVYVVSR